jgi:uncharacterized protein YdaU (DUF1376 family)
MEKEWIEMSKLPYFKFFPQDFIIGTLYMSNSDIGAYIKLLCYQWDHGSIPSDLSTIEKISGGCSDDVLTKFEKLDGVLKNIRLEKERTIYELKCNKNRESIKSRYERSTNVVRTYNERSTNVLPSHKSEVRSQKSESRIQNTESRIQNTENKILNTGHRFARPTVEEVSLLIKERGYRFDADSFISFYYSNGWMVGKNKMNDWKSACVTWEKRLPKRELTIEEKIAIREKHKDQDFNYGQE